MTYWHKRLKKEIAAVLARDVDVGKVYEALYARTQQHIADLLTAYYERFVVGEEDPYQIAQEFDVQAFMDQARIYVESQDFSPQANRELKLYNFAMRVNQLELLEGRLRLAMATLRDEEIAVTKKLLLEEGLKAYEQQAGILKLAVPSREVMKQTIQTLSQTSFHGVVWSERVWQRQVGLGRLVQEVVEGVTLRGRSPLEFVPELRKQFSVGAYEAKRLAITESARLQSEVQKENYRFNHVEKYEYMAEPTACALCAALDGKTFKVSEMEPGTNACPMHPFCRCSTGPVPDEEGLEGMFRQVEEGPNLHYRKNTRVGLSQGSETIVRQSLPTLQTRQILGHFYDDLHVSDGFRLNKASPVKYKTAVRYYDQQLKEVLEHLHVSIKGFTEPKVVIVDQSELPPTAIASFLPIENAVFLKGNIASDALIRDQQIGVAYPDNPLSSLVHELAHWYQYQRAKRKRKGMTPLEIQQEIYHESKLLVENMKELGYNLEKDISLYAMRSDLLGDLEEVFAEKFVIDFMRKKG